MAMAPLAEPKPEALVETTKGNWKQIYEIGDIVRTSLGRVLAPTKKKNEGTYDERSEAPMLWTDTYARYDAKNEAPPPGEPIMQKLRYLDSTARPGGIKLILAMPEMFGCSMDGLDPKFVIEHADLDDPNPKLPPIRTEILLRLPPEEGECIDALEDRVKKVILKAELLLQEKEPRNVTCNLELVLPKISLFFAKQPAMDDTNHCVPTDARTGFIHEVVIGAKLSGIIKRGTPEDEEEAAKGKGPVVLPPIKKVQWGAETKGDSVGALEGLGGVLIFEGDENSWPYNVNKDKDFKDKTFEEIFEKVQLWEEKCNEAPHTWQILYTKSISTRDLFKAVGSLDLDLDVGDEDSANLKDPSKVVKLYGSKPIVSRLTIGRDLVKTESREKFLEEFERTFVDAFGIDPRKLKILNLARISGEKCKNEDAIRHVPPMEHSVHMISEDEVDEDEVNAFKFRMVLNIMLRSANWQGKRDRNHGIVQDFIHQLKDHGSALRREDSSFRKYCDDSVMTNIGIVGSSAMTCRQGHVVTPITADELKRLDTIIYEELQWRRCDVCGDERMFFLYQAPVSQDYGLLCGLCAARDLTFCPQQHIMSTELVADRFVKCDRCKTEGRRVKMGCAFGEYKRSMCAHCMGREMYPALLMASEPAEGMSMSAAVRMTIHYKHELYHEKPAEFKEAIKKELCQLFPPIKQKKGAATHTVTRSGLNPDRINVDVQTVASEGAVASEGEEGARHEQLVLTVYFHRDPLKPIMPPNRVMTDLILLTEARTVNPWGEPDPLKAGQPKSVFDRTQGLHLLTFIDGPVVVHETLVVERGEFDVPPPTELEMEAEPMNLLSGTRRWIELLEPPESEAKKGGGGDKKEKKLKAKPSMK